MPRSGGGGGGRSRGGGGGGGGRRGYSTGGGYSRPSSPPPYRPANPPGQPSMMKTMAATAGGVAAGHLLAAAILGSSRERIPPEVSCEGGNCTGIPPDDPCALELKNFVECAYRATDMNQCDGYNTLLKECRRYEEKQQR